MHELQPAVPDTSCSCWSAPLRNTLRSHTDARCAVLCVDTYGGGRLGGPSIKGPCSLLVTTVCHVRPKSLPPSVKKLSQEIKGKLESLVTGFFTTRSDAERADYLGRNRAIHPKLAALFFCDVQNLPARRAFRFRRILQNNEQRIRGADGQEELPRAPRRLLSHREVGSESARSLISCGSQLLKLASGSAQSV
jgi:hypothetical protein